MRRLLGEWPAQGTSVCVPGPAGTPNVAYAEWTQATIEPNWPSQVPEVVRTLNAEMQAQLDSYEIEFYELVTPEKLAERGVS